MKTEKRKIINTLILLPVLSLACSALTRSLSATSTPELERTFEPVTTPLLITPESLPEAQVDMMYEVKMQITQNVTPVGDMIVKDGELPAGLDLSFWMVKMRRKLSAFQKMQACLNLPFMSGAMERRSVGKRWRRNIKLSSRNKDFAGMVTRQAPC